MTLTIRGYDTVRTSFREGQQNKFRWWIFLSLWVGTAAAADRRYTSFAIRTGWWLADLCWLNCNSYLRLRTFQMLFAPVPHFPWYLLQTQMYCCKEYRIIYHILPTQLCTTLKTWTRVPSVSLKKESEQLSNDDWLRTERQGLNSRQGHGLPSSPPCPGSHPSSV